MLPKLTYFVFPNSKYPIMAASTNKRIKQEIKLKSRIKELRGENKSLARKVARLEKKAERADRKSGELKAVRLELGRARASRAMWRDRYKGLKGTLRPERVKSHPYCMKLILLGVILHITYGISLRATAKALYSVGLVYGREAKKASATTIRNWSLRLGLYYLTRQVQPGRYALIADESVSIGQEKLLVLLLVKLDGDRESRVAPLSMSDVSVLHVESKASWKGADIAEAIEDRLKECEGAEIAYSISDKGSNLLCAFKTCNIVWVSDCTHVISNCTQALFQKDVALNGLVKSMNATRAKWALSDMAVYIPPPLRNKARFHQLFTIYKWAQPLIDRWGSLPEKARLELVYLLDNRALIRTLQQIHSLIEAFAGLVKGKGINDCTLGQWQKQYDKLSGEWLKNGGQTDQRVLAYHQEIERYIEHTRATLPGEGQILSCSDVIESIFGKYKNKGRCPMITDDALKIAAYPRDIQGSDVLEAMSIVATQKVKEWKGQNTTVSQLAQKRKFKQNLVA